MYESQGSRSRPQGAAASCRRRKPLDAPPSLTLQLSSLPSCCNSFVHTPFSQPTTAAGCRRSLGASKQSKKPRDARHHRVLKEERRLSCVNRTLGRDADVVHLTLAVVAAGDAGNVTGLGSAAGGALVQMRGAPTVGMLTHLLLALGFSALRTGHGRLVSFKVRELVEGSPNPVAFRIVRLFAGVIRHGVELAFCGAFTRCHVSVFTARMGRKG